MPSAERTKVASRRLRVIRRALFPLSAPVRSPRRSPEARPSGPGRILRRPSTPIRGRRTERRPPLSRSKLRRVAGWSHILTFIAGAASTRLSVASKRVVARSSASPAAIRARICALAGATTIRSAARDSSIWPIAASSVRLKRSSRIGCPLSVAADKGDTNCWAAAVITTRTVAPRSLSRRINSSAL